MHSFFCPLYHILFSCNLQYSRRHLPVKNTRPKWQRKNARMPDTARYAGVYCSVTVLPHREVRCGSDFFQAAPHNSARSLRQDFCSNSKFRKWRNTVCISHFRNCGSGAKRRLRLADAIVRCCLNAIPLLEVSESLSRPWDEADEVSSGDFGTGRRLNPKSSSLNRLSENGSLLRVYLKTVNTPKQRVFSACCAPFFLAIHKVFLRKNGFIRRKIPRRWSYFRFSDRP